MTKLTTKKVKDYFAWRAGEDLRHCPNCIAAACNDAAYKFGHHDAKDLLKLVFFNDPIPALHTHNYGFHTATGRNIIQTIQEFYHEYENLEL
tara:strand:+ start:231 stop:506 length:276 start_codon:yes stop_codon:yes gene_type:complete